MSSTFFRSLGRFFEGTGDVIGTPSGDTRGHMRIYAHHATVTSGRNF